MSQQTERELFEKWYEENKFGGYKDSMWAAFQAGRASLPASDWNHAIEAAKVACLNNVRNDDDNSYDMGCRDCSTLVDAIKRQPSEVSEQP